MMRRTRRVVAATCCVVVSATGCAFHGLNSLPLPGTVGRGAGANIYHVELANVSTLESNSPVMIDDVVVGSVGRMTVKGWHADVEISVKRDVVVPANAVASVGQTSLLGSMHLELNPPLGQPGIGRLQPGATIPLNRASAYPSTEQTLSSLSVVVNGGGLGQIGEIVRNFTAALSGREGAVRDLINRLDKFVGTLDQQRDNIVASIQALNGLSATFAAQRDVLTRALRKVPPALEVLIRERPRLTTALDKLRVFSDTATGLINDTQADLVKNHPRACRRGSRARHRDRGGDGLPVHAELRRPSRSRRLLQPACRLGPDYSAAQTGVTVGHPLGATGRAGAARPGGTVLLGLHTRSAACRRQTTGARPCAVRSGGTVTRPTAAGSPAGHQCGASRAGDTTPKPKRAGRFAADGPAAGGGRIDAVSVRPNPAGDLHRRRNHWCDRDGAVLHSGANAARHRKDDGHLGAAGHRWPVPILQRDLPWGSGRQGDLGGVDGQWRESHIVA